MLFNIWYIYYTRACTREEMEIKMLEKVKKHIAELLGTKENLITPESKLVEDLKADSLDIVQMLIVLEDEFKVEFSDDEIASLKTVGDIVSFIEKKGK